MGHTPNKISYDNPVFHARELTVFGSRNAMGDDFRRTIALLEEGAVDVRPWLTHTCEVAEFPDEFLRWMKPETGVIKAMVHFADGEREGNAVRGGSTL